MARKVLVLSLVFLMIFSVSLWATKHAPLPNPPLADGSGYVLDYLITAPPPGSVTTIRQHQERMEFIRPT